VERRQFKLIKNKHLDSSWINIKIKYDKTGVRQLDTFGILPHVQWHSLEFKLFQFSTRHSIKKNLIRDILSLEHSKLIYYNNQSHILTLEKRGKREM
jgi:hypothetical protein